MLQIKEITEKQKEFLYGQSLVQYKNISNIKVYEGHKVFKMAIDTLIITVATYDIEIIQEGKRKYKKLNLKYEPGNIYIPALNIKNASKKAGKIIKIVDNIIKREENGRNNRT